MSQPLILAASCKIRRKAMRFCNLLERMGRDSNPRYGFPYSSFQDCRLRPLGHPSGVAVTLNFAATLRRRGKYDLEDRTADVVASPRN